MELNRETFKQNRSLEFFSEKELSMQIGHDRRLWGKNLAIPDVSP